MLARAGHTLSYNDDDQSCSGDTSPLTSDLLPGPDPRAISWPVLFIECHVC